MEPTQIIKDALEDICKKGRIGKRVINTIEENIKLLTKLNKKQKLIIANIQEQLNEGTLKKSEVEKLTQILKEFNENFDVETDVTKNIDDLKIINIDHEKELDTNIKKYIGMSEKRPMECVNYDVKNNIYRVTIDGKVILRNKDINIVCSEALKNISAKFSDKIGIFCGINKRSFEYKSRRLIAYYNKTNVLFDIQHVLQILDLKKSQLQEKYNEYCDKITHYIQVKNEYGGYFIRELIPVNVLCDLAMSSNSDFSKALRKNIGDIVQKLFYDGYLNMDASGNFDVLLPAVPQIVLPQSNLLMPPQQPVVNQRRKTIQREILGYDTIDILPRLELCVTEISCIYLFVVGKVDKLRQEMNIDPKFDDNMYVIKYGLTNDLARRTNEHMRKFNELQESELKLKYYVPMLELYLPEAEIEIETYFDTLNSRIKWKDMVELAVMTVPMIEALKTQYINLGKTRGGTLVEITQRYETKQKDLQHEKEMFEVKELMYKEQISNLTQRNKILEEIHKKDQGKLVDDILHKIKTIKKWFDETYKISDSDNVATESISIKTLYREFITKNQIDLTEHEFKTIMKKDTELSNNMKFDAVKKSTRLVGFVKK